MMYLFVVQQILSGGKADIMGTEVRDFLVVVELKAVGGQRRL